MERHKGKISVIALLILVIIATAGVYLGNSYNRLVTKTEAVNSSWMLAESQYQNRLDLIPDLINTLKNETGFEQLGLNDLLDAQAHAAAVVISPDLIDDSSTFHQFQQSQDMLDSALAKLKLNMEKDPDLKVNQHLKQVMAKIAVMNSQILIVRDKYTKAVQDYNLQLSKFPQSYIANVCDFQAKACFESSDIDNIAPGVDFN